MASPNQYQRLKTETMLGTGKEDRNWSWMLSLAIWSRTRWWSSRRSLSFPSLTSSWGHFLRIRYSRWHPFRDKKKGETSISVLRYHWLVGIIMTHWSRHQTLQGSGSFLHGCHHLGKHSWAAGRLLGEWISKPYSLLARWLGIVTLCLCIWSDPSFLHGNFSVLPPSRLLINAILLPPWVTWLKPSLMPPPRHSPTFSL